MLDDDLEKQATQVNKIMEKLCPQLPKVKEGETIADALINSVQDILKNDRDEIIAIAAVVGGLAVLVPAVTVAIITAIGFTAGGVAAGSLAAAFQSSVYGGLTSGVFSVLQSFGATATAASPLVVTAAGTAVAAGGGYLAYKEAEKHAPFIEEQTRRIAGEADNHLRAAGEGVNAALHEAGKGVAAAAEQASKGVSDAAENAGKDAGAAAKEVGKGAANFFGEIGQACGQ